MGLFVRSADEPATTSSQPATPPVAPAAALADGSPPSWIIGELPPAHAEIALKIEALRKDAQKYEGVAGVLWQVGQPLAEGIRDIFQELTFEATLTAHDGGHNVRVHLGNGRRLIVEVAGAAEAIERKAPAITELLRLLQEEAGDKDRLVLAVNAWCHLPIDARKSDLITPEALKIAQRVGANVVATSTLFGIWKYSLTDLDAARQSVMQLYSHDGGIFK